MTDQESKKQTESARRARHEKSRTNDMILKEFIRNYPGKTSTQLEEIFKQNRFRFERSYLVNALQRLESEGEIISRPVESEKKIVNRYYINYDNGRPVEEVEIVKGLFKPEDWKGVAFLYALANNEIRVCAKKDQKLEESSFAHFQIHTKIVKENLCLILPKQVVRFYKISPDKYDTDISGDIISIKVNPKKEKSMLRKKILILEDDEYWRDILKDKFIQAGHEVETAKSVAEAYRYLDKGINFLVLDWEISHQKVAEEVFLQFRERNSEIRGSLISANPISNEKWKEFTKLGFVGIIPKHASYRQRISIEEIANEQVSLVEMT